MQRFFTYEQSPRKLAFTFVIGVYIGISPFVGFHTLMTFVFGWLFTLSIPALLAISIAVNNPWTMVPVYSLDHYFGKWLLHLFKIDFTHLEPAWIDSCNSFLHNTIGISGLSLSAFLIGGNILGISVALALYPLSKKIFALYLSKQIPLTKQPLMTQEN